LEKPDDDALNTSESDAQRVRCSGCLQYFSNTPDDILRHHARHVFITRDDHALFGVLSLVLMLGMSLKG
jgi:hypothetical protein